MKSSLEMCLIAAFSLGNILSIQQPRKSLSTQEVSAESD